MVCAGYWSCGAGGVAIMIALATVAAVAAVATVAAPT